MAQSKRRIDLSVCKIRKEVPGNLLATVGSACVLEWPGNIASSSETGDHAFLVTTSQVLSKGDLNSSVACTADFLPLKRGSIETFDLNNVPFYEKHPSDQNIGISLILIPTEALHKQKRFSSVRKNKFQSDRSQLCRSSKSKLEAADDKPEKLYCFVLCETASEGDKFYLQSYLLDVDECGSYFLQFLGNKSKLRSLQDFRRSDRTENPIGSVILNNDTKVVGFLAFDEKNEILPLFLPHDVKGDKQTSNGLLMVDLPNHPKSAEGRSSDGQPSDNTSHNETDRDANGNKEDNLFPDGRLHMLSDRVIIKTKDQSQGDSDNSNHNKLSETDQQSSVPLDDDDDDDENLMVRAHISQQSQPTEMSFLSGMEEPRISDDGEEAAFEVSLASQDEAVDQLGNGAAEDPEHQRSPMQRSCSEKSSTPRTKRKLLLKGYHSQPGGLLPLKPETLVERVILYHVYIMDTLRRYLDTTYIKNNENWQHLAHRGGVPDEVVMQLKCQSPASRSEALFQVLCTTNPNLTIGTLRRHLEDLQMEYLVTCLRDHQLHDHLTVYDLSESGDFPGKFFVLLDQVPEEYWKSLGGRLDVDPLILEGIKTDCATQHQNPAQEVIELIYTSRPMMTIHMFKEKLKEIEREDIVTKKLDGLRTDEYATIKDLRDDLDLMREVTRMLNAPENWRGIKNYKDLARACNIPAEKYESLQPPCAQALFPTEEVIKDIVRRHPNYTVEKLFTDLRDMDRLDVINAISRYFVEEDVKALKRKLKIPYE